MKVDNTGIRKLVNLLSVALAATAVLAACTAARPAGESGQDSSTQPASGQGATSLAASLSEESRLEEAARLEGGEVAIYTSMSIDDLEFLLARFKESYPFTRPTYYRASGDDVIQKSMTEAQAGQHFADVFDTEAFEVTRLLQAGLLQPFVAPQSEAYPAQAKDPEGYWTVNRINTVVIGYNTELVDPLDVPATWEDLLEPKWKGKMGVEANDVELFAGMVSVWGEEKTTRLWEGIAAQEPGIVDGHTELAQLVSAGEFAISPNLYAYRVERLKSDGAPIEWVRTDPIIAYSQLIAMAADAPHPATARLFINWALSEAGQNAIREMGRIPGHPDIQSDPPGLVEGLNLVFTVPAMADDFDHYLEQWRSILHLK